MRTLCHHLYKSAVVPHFLVLPSLAHDDVGDLVGGAFDVAGPILSLCESENKDRGRRGQSDTLSWQKTPSIEAWVFLSVSSGKPTRGRDMKIEIRLRIDAGESNSCEEEVWVLDKAHDQLEHIGLSLDEAKALLGRLQERVVAAQAAAFVDDNRCCGSCGARLWSKGQASFTFRTPFGDVAVASPRLKRCRCDKNGTGTFSPLAGLFSEHVAPEMLYLETKWASLASFGVTVEDAEGRPPGRHHAQR